MKTSSQWILLISSLLIAIVAYFYIDHALQQQKLNLRKPMPALKEQAIDVTTIKVKASRHRATIKASGLANPRYQLSLTSQVSGEVIHISKQLEIGQRVKQGDVLATLSNRQLNSAVASAKKALASAELALKEEIRQGDQARAEWQAAGFKGAPDSDLVLRVPQLAYAKADVNAAKAALAEAQDDLQHTQIVAPFDALVISRNISPGSYLNAGSEIATLYSTDRAEITINLATSDWQKLPSTASLLSQDWPVAIHSIDSNDSWQGKVLSVDQHIDSATRMRSLIVGLASPLDQTPKLLPGAFVSVQLQGRTIANLWQLPSSALSQKSEIWYLDDSNRLAAFETTPLFVDAHSIYIQVPKKLQSRTYDVLVKPYSSYLVDTLVNPVEQAQQ